jgi:hypothetical protein
MVDAHHDVTVARQVLGDGGQQQRREPARRQQQHRIRRLIVGHRRVYHGVAEQAGDVQSEKVAGRSPRLGQIGRALGVWVGRSRIPDPQDQLTAILWIGGVDLDPVRVDPIE